MHFLHRCTQYRLHYGGLWWQILVHGRLREDRMNAFLKRGCAAYRWLQGGKWSLKQQKRIIIFIITAKRSKGPLQTFKDISNFVLLLINRDFFPQINSISLLIIIKHIKAAASATESKKSSIHQHANIVHSLDTRCVPLQWVLSQCTVCALGASRLSKSHTGPWLASTLAVMSQNQNSGLRYSQRRLPPADHCVLVSNLTCS